MKKVIHRGILLLCGAISLGHAAWAQQPKTSDWRHPETDVALTYTAERGKVASVDCGCFWLQGGSADVASTFYRGLGVAANLTGGHNSTLKAGVGLDKITFGIGPRYTYRFHKLKDHQVAKYGVDLFGQTLFGVAHGYNSTFPTSTGTTPAATSFALQVGGGVNVGITKLIGVRLFEADYVRSTLPNNASNTQNDLRISAGVSFHFGR